MSDVVFDVLVGKLGGSRDDSGVGSGGGEDADDFSDIGFTGS